MALNLKHLFTQVLPQVDFNITSCGITILSPRLTTPRLIPYDQAGRCKECKSTEVELDFIVTKEGVTIYCTRLSSGSRFVPFDSIYELPTHCFFKVKNKGRVFNVPHGLQNQQTIHNTPNSKSGKRKFDELSPSTTLAPPTKYLTSPPRQVSPPPTLATNLPSPPRHISYASLIPSDDSPPRPDTPPEEVPFEKELQEFYDSLMAATTGLTSSPKKMEEKVEKKEEKDDTKVPI
ncbi:unnamed protein product [Meloidogyne enterolobii]|uniref:Uncharacterized protein n=2 Tax=Meloidogyne enterolobii TaxID=390850 RepID=A0ACB1AA52_MELEN|nr:unnamed protein product [Meloidogyne enterolobii]